MTIEQAAQQLAEAVKAIGEAIHSDDATDIFISGDGIGVHVLNKDVFSTIATDQTSLDWHGDSRKYFKMVKRVAGVNFFTLIEVDGSQAPNIPVIPPDVAEKAMAMMRRDSVD